MPETNRLFFNCTCGKSVDHIFDEQEVQDYDRHCDKYRSRRKACELGIAQAHKSDGYGVKIAVFEQKFGKNEVRPRPCKRCEQSVYDHRHCYGQRYANKHLKVARSVYTRRLIHRVGDRIEEPFLRQISHRCASRIDKHQTPKLVYKVELRHQEIHGGHSHKRRKHTEHHRQFHYALAPVEPEPRNDIGCEYYEETAEKRRANRNYHRVAEPTRIVVQFGVGEQLYESIDAVRTREEPLERIHRTALAERRQNKPYNGECKDKGDNEKSEIGEKVFEELFRGKLSAHLFTLDLLIDILIGFGYGVHLYISSLLYDGDLIYTNSDITAAIINMIMLIAAPSE